MRSHEVLSECRHAISLQREGFIRPVYWQDPLPEDPQNDLPPTPIRRLHFSRLTEPGRHVARAGDTSAPVVENPPPLPPHETAEPTKSSRRARSLVSGMAAATLILGVGAVVLQGGRGGGSDSSEGVPTSDTEASAGETQVPAATQVPVPVSDGVTGLAVVDWRVGGIDYRATVDVDRTHGVVDVQYFDADGVSVVVRQDLTLGTDRDGTYYAGSSPRFVPGDEPVVDYLGDMFRVAPGRDGQWTIDWVCDVDGCYPASTTRL